VRRTRYPGVVRALLVVNPRATAATRHVRDLLVERLGAEASITEAVTEYRGHAIGLARRAADRGDDLVVAVGGDGTVNEVVNGLLAEGHDRALPRCAVVPCGFANIFARALGLPDDPVAAVEALAGALRADRARAVSMGAAGDRYFTFCAGLGFDATVVRRVEARRSAGRRSTAALYVRSALREYVAGASRKPPRTSLLLADGREVHGAAIVIVSNTTPWTYLGSRALTPTPLTGFETGLDVFAMTSFGVLPVARSAVRLLSGSPRLADPRWSVSFHDLSKFTLRSSAPVDLQLDGEYLTGFTEVRFRAIPGALHVVV
jgi:diacylglycerol kinase family enzyme